MRILLTTLGSRGDVQPYLALAGGLQRAGHHPTLAAPESFAGWIQAHGVDVAPLSFNPQEVMQRLGKGGGGFRTLVSMLSLLKTGMQEVQAEVWRAAQATDFLIQSATGLGALETADLRGIPVAFAYLFPFAPTRAFPMFWLPYRVSLGGTYNLLTHNLMARLLWRFGGAVNNQWRKQLGLKPWRSFHEMMAHAGALHTPFLYGYSPALLPKPVDWDAYQHVTGYWFLDNPEGFQPPADLLRFLEEGPPPIYLGFGSMHAENPTRNTRLALRALELTGHRGLILTGWGGMTTQPASPRVMFVDSVPHEWLFPRVGAVVHHGGAGTTGAGLRAGVPQVIVPFGGDQFAWSELVVRAGIGPKTPGIKKLTAEKLAEAIDKAIHDSTMRAGAATLEEKIRFESGIARAIGIIEQHANDFSTRPT